MKMYGNGQRPTKMYGGGMASPRKPMQMGGLAQQNRTQQTPMAKNMGMGMMTEQKKYGMGMNLGGAIKKFEGRQKAALGVKAAKPDFLDLDKDGNTTEPMKTAAKSAKKGKTA